MKLWIRSQDKTRLSIINNIQLVEWGGEYSLVGYTNDYVDDFDLGKYKTKERALEVLDKIESIMQTNCGFELYSRTGEYPDEFNKKWNCVPVYQMPSE